MYKKLGIAPLKLAAKEVLQEKEFGGDWYFKRFNIYKRNDEELLAG